MTRFVVIEAEAWLAVQATMGSVIPVTTIRLQTVLVLAVLVVLLLQLPRLDDPAALRLVGGEIDRIAEIRGGALYAEVEGRGTVLVYVTELWMHEAPSGTAYVTKLDGMILDEGRRLEPLHMDATARAAALGWRRIAELDGITVPGSMHNPHPHEFRKLRLRKAIHEGREVLLVVGRLEGLDLVAGKVVSEDFDEKRSCPAVPYLERVSVPGGAGTFWALTGTVCWEGGRTPSRASLAWSAGYAVD